MLNLPPQLRIANAAAILEGPHGAVTRRAHQQGLSRQAAYRDTARVLQARQQPAPPPQLQPLREQLDALRSHLTALQEQLDTAVLLDEDCRAAFASTAQAEGVSLPVARRLLA